MTPTPTDNLIAHPSEASARETATTESLDERVSGAARATDALSASKREKSDAFFGGMCAALSVVACHDRGTIYEEIVQLGGRELLAIAVRNDDIEIDGIRKALAELNRRKRLRRASPTLPNKPNGTKPAR